jgi:hypothetical protein
MFVLLNFNFGVCDMFQSKLKMAISSVLCGSFFLFSPVSNAAQNDGLVAHWSFDDCTAKDVSGNGHDGAINGNPQCVEGKKGKAFNFNATGASDYIDLGTSIPALNNYTIAGWINIAQLPEYVGKNRHGVIFSRGGVSTNEHESFNFYVDGSYNPSFLRSDVGTGAPHPAKYDSVPDKAEERFTPPENSWIFVVSTNNGNQMALYNNAKLVSSAKASLLPQAGDLQSSIGKSLNETYWNYDDSYGFTGMIDDLRIYNRALSETEIKSLYSDTPGISGNINGVQKFSAVCKNLKTGVSKKIAFTDGAKPWDCTAAGLKAKKGEQVNVSITGMAK